MKGISPLIATVIIVAVTIVAAILVTSSTTSVIKTQTETTTKTQKCPSAALELLDYRCVNTTNPTAAGSAYGFDTIRASITNVGSVTLSNFSIFALVDTSVYNNATPDNGATLLSPGASTTLSATTTLNGTIAKLRVMAGGDCPGVFIEITNDTKAIGSCNMIT